ncbi:hypothetical protein AB0465_18015 [Streptomyces griseoviridis]|uniref:hypothetical protein n=1 Tax=Streptomyces TaxID=1883 RepID=UPI00340BBDC6
MLPLIAGLLGRAAATEAVGAVTGTAARSAVTSAASSGAISAGTSAASNSGRVLSTMQFGSAAARAMSHDGAPAAAPAPSSAPADDLGWARS